MTAALRSEWIKLRTIRMNWVLVIVAAAFPLVVTILVMALSKEREIDANDTIGGIAGTSVVTAMLLGVIGAATITSEFGFGTIRVTFAAEPRRSVVLIAKAIITVLTAVVVEAVVVAACWLAASVIASARDVPIDLADGRAGTAPLVGAVVLAAIVALLGYGLGLLVRLTPVAVAILILWPLVIEGLVGGIMAAAGVESPFKFLPYQSGISMVSSERLEPGETFGRIGGGLYFFAVTAVVALVGAFFTRRRDA